MMQFEEMNIINASFNIVYPRKVRIAEKCHEHGNLLMQKTEEYYLPPNFVPIPPEVEPEIPRIIFNAINRHNQMSISQINAKIDAQFDFRYQRNYSQCIDYIEHRTKIMREILTDLGVTDLLYQGLTITAQFPQSHEDHEITQYLVQTLNKGIKTSKPINEINQKFTFILDEKYYVNIVLGNYRNYNFMNQQDDRITSSLAEARLLEKGIFISLDVNNRYQYNLTGEFTKDVEGDLKTIFDFTRNFLSENVIKILKEGDFSL